MGSRGDARDEAARRVRLLTALAGAGSLAGTGGVLLVVAGSATVAPAPAAAAQPAAVNHEVPSSLLTTKHRHRARPRTTHRIRQPRPAATHTVAAPAIIVRRAAPARSAPKPTAPQAPRQSAQPAPQPTDSSGSASSSGGSHHG